jgi:cytochrome c-L
MDNSPLKMDLLPGQQITSAVQQFRATKSNPYRGDTAAAAGGKELYEKWCQACHLPDATGRIGPNLIDNEYRYPRANTDVGEFEVIYGGATGAMQAFGDRVTQDEILKIMAYIQTLKKR